MIDLGTNPMGSTLDSVTLDDDALDFLVAELTIAEVPVVLNVFPRYDAQRSAADAIERGRARLLDDGLLPGGDVHPDLRRWARVLEQPTWYTEIRRYGVEGGAAERDGDEHERDSVRACFASNETTAVLAERDDTTVRLRPAPGPAVRQILAAARIRTDVTLEPICINVPTDALTDVLDAAGRTADPTSLVRIGVAAEPARIVASAMSTCRMITEIGAVTRRHGQRIVARHPVAIFETARGTLVATSSTAQDGRAWSTLSDATPATLRRAVSALLDRARNQN